MVFMNVQDSQQYLIPLGHCCRGIKNPSRFNTKYIRMRSVKAFLWSKLLNLNISNIFEGLVRTVSKIYDGNFYEDCSGLKQFNEKLNNWQLLSFLTSKTF